MYEHRDIPLRPLGDHTGCAATVCPNCGNRTPSFTDDGGTCWYHEAAWECERLPGCEGHFRIVAWDDALDGTPEQALIRWWNHGQISVTLDELLAYWGVAKSETAVAS